MQIRAFISALEAIAAEKGDDFPVWVPDMNCGCCNAGPHPVEEPQVWDACDDYKEEHPECVYLMPDYATG